jgi:multidrug resistance efflux pump
MTARLDLEHSAVRAPFDGLVLAVNAAPGQSVVSEMQSQPLVTLAANQVYRARAQIDLAQAGQLVPGQRLQASVRGRPIEGSVAYIGFEPVAQSAQGPQYELVAEFAVTDQQPLRVGETVILHLE